MITTMSKPKGVTMSRKAPVVVIKVGSNALLDGGQHPDPEFIAALAEQLAALVEAGKQPVVVSSGAVASGMASMQLSERPLGLPERQALAAIGQAGMMNLWQQALHRHHLHAAQLLLTADDFDDRLRYLNLTASLRACFTYGVIPVVNENDTVVVDELTLGDNDRLSAIVASQLGAVALLLLTDIDGCYSQDPRHHQQAHLITHIDHIDDDVLAGAGDGGAFGRGGMASKLLAAKLAAEAGVPTTICKARTPEVITRIILKGETLGTRVAADLNAIPSSRHRWLALARSISGTITVDQGAAQALIENGTSLLPVGIVKVCGDFTRGDTVSICLGDKEIARGLASLSSQEMHKLQGIRLEDAHHHLNYAIPKSAVHRDNLFVVS